MSLDDVAQEFEAAEWERRNAPRPERPTYKPGDALYGPAECYQCPEPLPELRRAMGCQLCTACQTIEERRKKLGLETY